MKAYPQKPTHTHFSEAEMMPAPYANTYKIREIFVLGMWALDIGNKTSHHWTEQEANDALIEYLQKKPNEKWKHNHMKLL